MENKLRSLVKSISWRAIAAVYTIILVFLFTKSIAISFGIGFIEIFIKFIFYYFHERMWQKIKWGIKKGEK